jgi:Ca-activated chloride channel homolog
MWRFIATALALGYALAAQDAPVSITPRASARATREPRSIRLDVRMVVIPVTVTDPLGAPVPGMRAGAFRLFEDGVEQKLSYFASDDAPISAGVVFDASRSMENKLDQSRDAVARFLRTEMPGDEFFLVEFNDTPRLLCNFTSDTGLIERALSGIQPKNWTSLLDAVYMAVHHIREARNARKALLVVSDGADNNSRYTEAEMKRLVREADVSIYAIAISGGLINRHVRLLRELSRETGGQTCEVDRLADLPEAIAKIDAAMRRQYLLGYTPARERNDGMYRKIEVRLEQGPGRPRLHASWRTGYYAPAD